MLKKISSLTLLVAALLTAAPVHADWKADRAKPGPIRVGSDSTTNDAPLLLDLKLRSMTYLNASTTSQTSTVKGVKVGDAVFVQPMNYTGSAYVLSTSASLNRVYVRWNTDPGTTVTLKLWTARL